MHVQPRSQAPIGVPLPWAQADGAVRNDTQINQTQIDDTRLDDSRSGQVADWPVDVANERQSGIDAPLVVAGSTEAASPSLTTVVLCTTGFSAGLVGAMKSILAQSYHDLELVVVDNRPATGVVRQAVGQVADRRVRYVAEPIAGLSTARNAGIRHARGSVIAFTDDDCVPDREWISSIRRVLDQYPLVDCVTGRTVPLGDSSEWERLFEEFGSFDRGEEPLVWRKAAAPAGDPGTTAAKDLPGVDGSHSRIYPYTGVFGSGNNMAFRSSIFAFSGGFDEALGTGTPSGGGEDLDMFIRLILADGILAFEPSALVRHQHRANGAALRLQIRSYGSGLSAMITKQLLTDHGWKLIAHRIGPGIRHLLSPSSKKNIRKTSGYPLELTLIEWWGVMIGPWLYLRGRRAVRRRSRPGVRFAAPVSSSGC